MEFAVYDQKGKASKSKVELSDVVAKAPVNKDLLAQYVYVYLANRRATISHTKNRGEVRGGGKKPWRQKGTGRARAGSSRSPIWRKGGIVFGPRAERNWSKDMSKQMKLGALRSALAMNIAADQFKVTEPVVLPETKWAKALVDFKSAVAGESRKATLLVGAHEPKLVKAANSIAGLKVVLVSDLNAYDVINSGALLATEDAVKYINEKWGNK